MSIKYEYTILRAEQSDLGRKVTEHLNNGWQLSGNLVVETTSHGYGIYYAQAMIKKAGKAIPTKK